MYENRLPLSAFDIVTPSSDLKSLTFRIEARRAKLTDNSRHAPCDANAWRYIRKGSKEDNDGVVETFIGPVLNVMRGHPLTVTWINMLGGMDHGMKMAARPVSHDGPMQEAPPINALPMDFNNDTWRAMNASVGVVAHLHGVKARHDSDGWPLSPVGYVGSERIYGFPSRRQYCYPNDQRAAMLWFHDHAMDNTAVQVHAGLAGLYFIRDESDQDIFAQIGGSTQEIPLVIQDRVVDCSFQYCDYWAGVPTRLTPNDKDPARPIGEFIRPEFLGETIFVNGRPSPFTEVERKVYRLRILNGSNARTYALALIDPAPWLSAKKADSARVWYSDLLTVIGNDAGLISKPATLDRTGYILIAPGERLDLLLDLTDAALADVSHLRLVNLCLASLATNMQAALDAAKKNSDPTPEALFQTEEPLDSLRPNASAAPSSILPRPQNEFDLNLLPILSVQQANILQFCIGCGPAAQPVDAGALARILAKHADDEGFKLSGEALVAAGQTVPARNRFVLLMNNTIKVQPPTKSAQTGEAWRDTQIWELTTAPLAGTSSFEIPFDVDTEGDNPPLATSMQTGAKSYWVARSTWFDQFSRANLIDERQEKAYPEPHAPTFRPREGTWERWYVANIGNNQPLRAVEDDGAIPDMHPFHMHLVNFVVTRRWRLNATTDRFEESPGRRLDFDRVARHDTVRVQANELVELLVYFPKGYVGEYPYHCHLVEHEDMGMMLHFEVQPG